MQYVLALGLLAVLACLATAGFFLLRRPSSDTPPAHDQRSPHAPYARALAWRVAISVVLFVCLLLAWHLGYVQPSGLRMVAG